MAFASQQPVEVLATPEELKLLDNVYDEDPANKMSRLGGVV